MTRITWVAVWLLIFTACAKLVIWESPRERALIPALRASWPGVSADVERGIQDGQDDRELPWRSAAELRGMVADIGAALAIDDGFDQVRHTTEQWPSLRPWGDRGIDDRMADGETTAEECALSTDRLDQFDAAIAALQGE